MSACAFLSSLGLVFFSLFVVQLFFPGSGEGRLLAMSTQKLMQGVCQKWGYSATFYITTESFWAVEGLFLFACPFILYLVSGQVLLSSLSSSQVITPAGRRVFVSSDCSPDTIKGSKQGKEAASMSPFPSPPPRPSPPSLPPALSCLL